MPMKLQMVRDESGAVNLMTYQVRKEMERGQVRLSKKEAEKLKEGGVLRKEIKEDGIRKQRYVQLDRETNSLMIREAASVRIADNLRNAEKLKDIELGTNQKQAVMEGKPRNSHAHGWSPIASHYIEVTLKPGESKDFVFLLGYIENEQDEKFEAPQVINKQKAHALIAELDTTAKVDQAFAELCEYWDALLNIYKVKTGNDKLDRMVNIWNQYQCIDRKSVV